MSIRRFVIAFVATAALVSSAAVAVAQGEYSSMQGKVTDEADGTPLANAVIKLRDINRGRTFTIKTNDKGIYYKRGLPGSEYDFVVEFEGYHPVEDHLTLNSGAEHRFNFELSKKPPPGAVEFAEGYQAMNAGDVEGAISAFEAAVAAAPELPEVHVNLALAYLRVDRDAEAVAQLEEAARLSPEQPRVLFQLGGAYVEMSDWDKAIEAFQAGLAKQPDLTDDLAREATVTLGAVYFAKGENDRAIELFNSALAVEPGAPVATLGLAKAILSAGDIEEALRLFQQVVDTAPGTPEAAQAEIFLGELQKSDSSEAPAASGGEASGN